jgi:hypothetical protein
VSSGWGLGGILGAALLLIAFEVTVTSPDVTGLAGLLALPGRLAQSWMNPAVPLIPDNSSAPAASSTSPAAGTSSAAPPSPEAQIVQNARH